MRDLKELYQSVILDHNRNPRNFGPLEEADGEAEGYNPLCGDRFTVRVRIEDDVIADVKFEGMGCAISKASASVMTTLVKGKSRADARAMFDRFHQMVTGQGSGGNGGPAADSTPEAGSRKLAVFAGVAEFPSRVKCAILSWHALKAALEEPRPAAVSTE